MPAKMATEEFIEKARSIHGDKYDYSKVEYEKSSLKVTITCSIHGDFEQTPNNHLSGRGCLECKNENRNMKKEEFINRAKEVHGGKYDYSKIDYKNNMTKVVISCPEHGEFKQTPSNHLFGHGCSRCGFQYRTKEISTEEFIEKAKAIHGDRYDYSKVEYSKSYEKVTITCLVHGEFEQTPNSHLLRKGCPECSAETRGFWNPKFIRKHHQDKLNNPCTLYVLECYSKNERFIKVGITTKTLEERYKDKKDFGYQYNTIHEYHSTLLECSTIEQELLKEFQDFVYQPIKWFKGSTECVSIDQQDSIIRSLNERNI